MSLPTDTAKYAHPFRPSCNTHTYTRPSKILAIVPHAQYQGRVRVPPFVDYGTSEQTHCVHLFPYYAGVPLLIRANLCGHSFDDDDSDIFGNAVKILLEGESIL